MRQMIRYTALAAILTVLLAAPLAVALKKSASTELTPDTVSHGVTKTNRLRAKLSPGPVKQDAPLNAITNVGARKPLWPSGSQSVAVGLPWYSFNGGGIIGGSSVSNRAGSSVGQSLTGAGNSPDHQMGLGFWYGAKGCRCPYQADMDGNGTADALDLAFVIDAVFFGGVDPIDRNCPAYRSDADCTGTSDAVDLAIVIDFIFFGGPGPCNPCGD